MEESLTNFVVSFAQSNPNVTAVLLVIGALRAINKPLFSFLHKLAREGKIHWLEKWVSDVESHKIYKTFTFGLDWIGSIDLSKK